MKAKIFLLTNKCSKKKKTIDKDKATGLAKIPIRLLKVAADFI